MGPYYRVTENVELTKSNIIVTLFGLCSEECSSIILKHETIRKHDAELAAVNSNLLPSKDTKLSGIHLMTVLIKTNKR